MTKKFKEIQCNLCGMILPHDELIKIRTNRHSIFHSTALIQKRNCIRGNPNYLFR